MTKLSRGSRNLILLGLISILIALTTTGISVAIYHYSGDMYLDSSRPGHLPEKKDDQSEDESTAKYTLPDTGPVDDKTIDDFLYYYNEQLDRVNAIETPYSSAPLSNESLGIPVELAIPEDVD
ncbi:hypothetical protein IJH97_01775 [Candidatus Saccharibacteria bacterium]|nr:hypothetical protein [Candidatus Saccharibacteria bacterium]